MNTTNWLNSPVAEALGWTLLHALWQGFAIIVPTALALHFMRNKSALVRYRIGLGGLLGQLIASVATFGWCYDPLSSIALAENTPLMPSSLIVSAASESGISSVQSYMAAHLPQIVSLWIVGVLVFGLRLLGGWVYIQRLRRSATLPVPALLTRTAEQIAERLNVTVRLQVSARVAGPIVVGIWKPMVLWPVGLLTGLSATDVEAILAHELAHVRRHDYLINVLQSAMEVVFFFHPAIWWLSARVREEREHCCDDVAVCIVGDARVLARALARVEEWQRSTTETPALAMAFASRRQLLLGRVRRMLGMSTRPLVSNGHLAGLTLATLLLLSISVYAVRREEPAVVRYEIGSGTSFGMIGQNNIQDVEWRGKRLPASDIERLQTELMQLIRGERTMSDLPSNDQAILSVIIDARAIQIAEKQAELKKTLDSLLAMETNRRHRIDNGSEYGMTNQGQITYIVWKGQKLPATRVGSLQEQLDRIMNGQLNLDALKQPDRTILLTIIEKNGAFDAGMRALGKGMAQIIPETIRQQTASESPSSSIQVSGKYQTTSGRDTTRMRAAQKELEALTRKMQEVMAQRQPIIDRLTNEIAELSLKISDSQKQAGPLVKQQTDLARKQAAAGEQQAALAQKLLSVEKDLERLSRQQSAQATKLKREKEQLRKQYEAEMDRLGEQMGKLGSQMGGLGTQMPQLDAKLQPLYQRLGVLTDSISRLSEPTYELSEKIGELSSQIAEDANEQAEKAMQMAEEALRTLDMDNDTPTPPARPARPSRPPRASSPALPAPPAASAVPAAPSPKALPAAPSAGSPAPARPSVTPVPAAAGQPAPAPALKGRVVKPATSPKPPKE